MYLQIFSLLLQLESRVCLVFPAGMPRHILYKSPYKNAALLTSLSEEKKLKPLKLRGKRKPEKAKPNPQRTNLSTSRYQAYAEAHEKTETYPSTAAIGSSSVS